MNTNFWDSLTVFVTLSFYLAVLGGAAYLVQVHKWDPWTMLLAILIIGGIRVRTGHFEDDKEEKKETHDCSIR